MIRSPRYGAVGESLLDGVEAVAERGRRNAFGAYEGLLLSEEVRERLARSYGPHYLWSPSLLETYAACPYRFFGEHVLRLAAPPELALESDVARRGSLLHDTLARLYEQVRAAGGPPPTPEAVAEQFAKTLDAVSAARPRRGLDAALREIERRQIAAWARRFAEQHREYADAWQQLDQPLAPEHFEARFGPASRRRSTDGEASLSTDTPLVIAVGGEEFRFTGQIDRIDVGRIGETVVFNVIDYKTGAKACVELDKVASGLQLQLPLYAIAAAELLLAEQNAQPLLSGYWSVRGKGFGIGGKKGPLPLGEIRSGAYHAADDWPDTRKAVEARIAEMVGGIRRGEFPVFNPDVRCGELCPLSTGCRVAHARSLEKAWPIEGAD
jgi:RecB family exonuclease